MSILFFFITPLLATTLSVSNLNLKLPSSWKSKGGMQFGVAYHGKSPQFDGVLSVTLEPLASQKVGKHFVKQRLQDKYGFGGSEAFKILRSASLKGREIAGSLAIYKYKRAGESLSALTYAVAIRKHLYLINYQAPDAIFEKNKGVVLKALKGITVRKKTN